MIDGRIWLTESEWRAKEKAYIEAAAMLIGDAVLDIAGRAK